MYSVTGNRNQNKETFLSPITRHWTSIVYLKHREESASCHHACILSHIQHDPWLTVGIRELLGFHSVDPFETEPAEGSANVSTTLKQFDTPEKKKKEKLWVSLSSWRKAFEWQKKKITEALLGQTVLCKWPFLLLNQHSIKLTAINILALLHSLVPLKAWTWSQFSKGIAQNSLFEGENCVIPMGLKRNPKNQ